MIFLKFMPLCDLCSLSNTVKSEMLLEQKRFNTTALETLGLAIFCLPTCLVTCHDFCTVLSERRQLEWKYILNVVHVTICELLLNALRCILML
jgi:hypothetical protein